MAGADLSHDGLADLLGDLLRHLQRTTTLTRAESARVVAEVLAQLDETPEAFVRRRHRELQQDGLANPAIFARLGDELQVWRFRAPTLTERQLRRIVYG